VSALSLEQRTKVHAELGRAYYRLMLAQEYAKIYKFASLESDITDVIAEVLRVRNHCFDYKPPLRGQLQFRGTKPTDASDV
jgi:hypothetical protein